ncbi:hypothetical protein EVAR_51597_1 [Eumeta japonica]|uniref:Uncharacterized protein n=1 Tax=Eumeta variegata TaxID=151549 RepID=A0A4C1YHZ1_EUMVA|nr:hypothetical protein EVAR_51597_1 [Eumeta japonica]
MQDHERNCSLVSATLREREGMRGRRARDRDAAPKQQQRRCGWESLMKSVTLGNVTMSHRTRERPAECLASLSHSTMIGLRSTRD